MQVLLATFFGVGRLPFAPGTWASAAALPIFWFLVPHPILHGAALVLVAALGVPVCTAAERLAGERDPGSVVLDEVAGMGTALLFLPLEHAPYMALMAFILFRLFDIWKPWPIHRIQDWKGGWGIMADDLLAGVYANLCVQAAAFFVRQIA
jgi:phosphatidylglycerophosphatase A